MKRFWTMVIVCSLLLLSAAVPGAWAGQKVLCSTFPVYLFTLNIVEGVETFQAALLGDPGLGCPHDYVLTPADLEHVSQADVLVVNGLGLESFLETALRVAKTDLTVIDSSRGVETRPSAAESEVHDDGPNPHIFASPRSAMAMVTGIAQGLAERDPNNAAIYNENARRFNESLNQLTGAFQLVGRELGNAKVAASHGIFDYMAHDLGLTIVASIEEAGGAAPSAARLAGLTRQIKTEGVRAILVDPTGDRQLAQTLGEETGLPVAVIDPVSSGPPDPPLNYYQEAMTKNLKVLAELLRQP